MLDFEDFWTPVRKLNLAMNIKNMSIVNDRIYVSSLTFPLLLSFSIDELKKL